MLRVRAALGMSKALSVDLRERVVAAIAAGASCRLKEIRAKLAEAGVAVGIGTLWRFFDRRRMTWKKSRPMPRSKTARTS